LLTYGVHLLNKYSKTAQNGRYLLQVYISAVTRVSLTSIGYKAIDE